jgi:dihydrofolate synthase/folylpolyglutamate synthase
LLNDTDPFTFLFGLERLGMKFGLENMRRLCTALGNPERRFTSVIVAGTNGKGSVTAMVTTALRAGGHYCARYTSPHLERLEERFVIDGCEVSRDTLAGAVARVQQAVEDMKRIGQAEGPPTFFECTTATAFELFAAAGVEIAVLEVGLGGRLDATNVVTPVAAAITSIDFDHQALLGGTIEQIAREKAGVIKPGIPVICGRLPDAALRVTEEVCDRQGARLIRTGREVSVACRTIGDRTHADFSTTANTFPDVTLALRGRHQADNGAVAIRLLEELNALGIGVDGHAIRAGLEHTAWPARLERVDLQGTEILLDAAHNPAGARALATFLTEAGWTGATLVFGALEDKDVPDMLAALARSCDRIICTTPASPRALPAHDTAGVAARYFSREHVEIVSDPAAALQRACAGSRRVVVAGSIFLVGPVRGILR